MNAKASWPGRGRAEAIHAAADLHYPGKGKVLTKILDGLEVKIVTEHDGGRPVRKAVVVAPGADGQPSTTALPDYIAAHAGDFLPALRTTPEQGSGSGSGTPPRRTPPGRPGESSGVRSLPDEFMRVYGHLGRF